jgi:uncharacterized protein (UPF0276 family)
MPNETLVSQRRHQERVFDHTPVHVLNWIGTCRQYKIATVAVLAKFPRKQHFLGFSLSSEAAVNTSISEKFISIANSQSTPKLLY